MSRPTEELNEAGCRLYLVSPRDLGEAFAPALEAALGVADAAAFLLRPALAQDAERHASPLRQICAARSVAFLVEDDVGLALALGADGVHLSDPGAVRTARARLGADRILGASCGRSRHAAMLAGDDGADYIAFGEAARPPGPSLLELVAWWHELFVLPCLVEGAFDRDSLGPLARCADFIGVGDAVWRHPDGAAAGVRVIREAIAGA